MVMMSSVVGVFGSVEGLELILCEVCKLVNSHDEGHRTFVVVLLNEFIVLLEDLIALVGVLFGGIGLAVLSEELNVGSGHF
jgi:hypothetical protein